MKVVVPYDHDPSDFDLIEMAVAVTRSEKEPLEGWKAAYRDTIDGRRVVWARFDQEGVVWVRDRNGSRRIAPLA